LVFDILQRHSRDADRSGARPGASRTNMQGILPYPHKKPLGNRLIASFPRNVSERIARHLRTVYLRRDDYIYQPGDRMEYIYFPQTAVFSEYQMLDDGRTVEIALVGNESAVGLMAAYGQAAAVNWTQVCVAGMALKIESDYFRYEIEAETPVKTLLNEQLNSYMRFISQKVICSTHHSVEMRLCTWLLMLADRCGSGPLKLTQEHLARVLGVYRPSVTCIARGLREQGVIDYVRGNVSIRDREKLIETACGCYREFCGGDAGDLIFPAKSVEM